MWFCSIIDPRSYLQTLGGESETWTVAVKDGKDTFQEDVTIDGHADLALALNTTEAG